MTPQAIAAFRIIIVAVGSLLVGRGLVSQDTVNTITDPIFLTAVLGGVAALVSAGYGIYKKSEVNIIKDASKVLGPDGVIVAPQAMADKLPKNVVATVEEAERVAPPAARKPTRRPSHPVPSAGPSSGGA